MGDIVAGVVLSGGGCAAAAIAAGGGGRAAYTGRLHQTLQRSTGGASTPTKVLRGWRLAIGFHNINAARFGSKVHFCFTELNTFLSAAALQLAGAVVVAAAIYGIAINMHLQMEMKINKFSGVNKCKTRVNVSKR